MQTIPAPGLDYTDLAYSEFNFYDQYTGYSASSIDKHLIAEETNKLQLELAPSEQPQVMHPCLEWRESGSTVNRTVRGVILCFMRKSPWNHIITLTKCLYIGGLWTGVYGNPFGLSSMNTQCLIMNCFLTSLDMVHTTYEEMESQPGRPLAFWTLFCESLSFD
jgi:hypothetical protein